MLASAMADSPDHFDTAADTPHTPEGLAFSHLVVQVFRLNGLLLQAGERLSQPSGQSSARWQVMGCIDEQAHSVAEVARLMGLTRQAVQRVADLLVADGLAFYRENPQHKRAQLLQLTKRGQLLLMQIEVAQRQWANSIGKQVNLADLEYATRLLGQLERLLQQ
jgi:DNA-binding MarR family transcriptional regulator